MNDNISSLLLLYRHYRTCVCHTSIHTHTRNKWISPMHLLSFHVIQMKLMIISIKFSIYIHPCTRRHTHTPCTTYKGMKMFVYDFWEGRKTESRDDFYAHKQDSISSTTNSVITRLTVNSIGLLLTQKIPKKQILFHKT